MITWLKGKALWLLGALTGIFALVALVWRDRARQAEARARVAEVEADTQREREQVAREAEEAAHVRRIAAQEVYHERAVVEAKIDAVEAEITKATPEQLADEINRAFGERP